jgi:hypothetical protein
MPKPGAILAVAISTALVGCAGGPKASFDSPDPLERTLALAETSRASNLSDAQLRQLIISLDSVDPAARLFAIRTLERETGETFGYRYYDPDYRRAPAVNRWVEWWSTRGGLVADSTGGDAR